MQGSRFKLAGLAGALTMLALAAPAEAGTYPMRSCNVPGAPMAGTGPWTWVNTTHSTTYNTCASGGSFGLQFPEAREIAARTSGALVLRRPSSGPQSRVDIRQMKLWGAARLVSSGSALYVQSRARIGGSIQQTDIADPPGGVWSDAPWTSPPYAAGTDEFSVLLLCANSTFDACQPADALPLAISGAEATLSEEFAPAITSIEGPLAAGQRQSGVQVVSYEALDEESGVARIEALLGGRVVAAQDFTAGPQCKYQSWNACDTRASQDLSADTRSVPDGTYTLQVRVTDAAGNTKTAQAAQPVIVANSPAGSGAPPSNGSGASRNAKLTATFKGRKGTTRTVAFSSGITVTGRLTTADGSPIADATLDVGETLARRTKALRTTSVKTDKKGNYSLKIRGRAGTRRIRVQYKASPSDEIPVVAKDLKLNVRASMALRVSLRGIRVSYSGKLRSGPIPKRGKIVYMQGRAIGGVWQTFATRRTSKTGRFSGRYKLRVRRPGVRLQFRARVPAEDSYPYVTTASRPITKRVR